MKESYLNLRLCHDNFKKNSYFKLLELPVAFGQLISRDVCFCPFQLFAIHTAHTNPPGLWTHQIITLPGELLTRTFVGLPVDKDSWTYEIKIAAMVLLLCMTIRLESKILPILSGAKRLKAEKTHENMMGTLKRWEESVYYEEFRRYHYREKRRWEMDMNRGVEKDMEEFEAMPMAKRVKRTREVVVEYRKIQTGSYNGVICIAPSVFSGFTLG